MPPSIYYVGGLPSATGYHVGFDMDATNERAYFEFLVPHDFTSLTTAVLIVIPNSTTTMRISLYSDYAAVGETRNVHSETSEGESFAVTGGEMSAVDISGILSNLAANDYVGIEIKGYSSSAPDWCITGIKITYS